MIAERVCGCTGGWFRCLCRFVVTGHGLALQALSAHGLGSSPSIQAHPQVSLLTWTSFQQL